MHNSSPVVLYLGCNGFPIGYAEVERQRMIAKAFVSQNVQVIVINRKGVHIPGNEDYIFAKGISEGIHYYYASGSPYRPSSFVRRNLCKLKGWLDELLIINKLIKGRQYYSTALISSMNLLDIIYYYFISRLFGFKIILDYTEYLKVHPVTGIRKINSFLFEKCAFKYTDGIIPISTFLKEIVLRQIPSKPVLQIPAVCDYQIFIQNEHKNDKKMEKYFLYCGSVNYSEVVEFIFQSFQNAGIENFKLYLVLNGTPDKFFELNKKILSFTGKNKIVVFSRLQYEELIQMYLHATALLIPLRNNEQDMARFPHKIGEYCASGNPMITTPTEEINRYFIDKENAIIASTYSIGEYSEAMRWVATHSEVAKEIGKKGRDLGLQKFHYRNYGQPLLDFITSL